jgi:hypothetical protein
MPTWHHGRATRTPIIGPPPSPPQRRLGGRRQSPARVPGPSGGSGHRPRAPGRGAGGTGESRGVSEVLDHLDDVALAATLDRTLAVPEPGRCRRAPWPSWPPEAPRDAAATGCCAHGPSSTSWWSTPTRGSCRPTGHSPTCSTQQRGRAGLRPGRARRGDPPLRHRAAAGLDGEQHRHVYCVNLGVRADAHVAVSGFPADAPGQDHGLWPRLHEAGYHSVPLTMTRVRTSPPPAGPRCGRWHPRPSRKSSRRHPAYGHASVVLDQ